MDYGSVEPLAIVPVADENANGIDEISVLGQVDSSTIAVVAKDAKTGEQISPFFYENGAPALIYFNETTTPIGFAPVGDANGDGPSEIAVLGWRKNGRSRLQSRELITGALVVNPLVFRSNWTPLIVRRLGDVNGNGSAGLAVAAVHNDGRVSVDILDGGTGTLTGIVSFFREERFDPRDMVNLRDISGNGIDELALIRSQPSERPHTDSDP